MRMQRTGNSFRAVLGGGIGVGFHLVRPGEPPLDEFSNARQVKCEPEARKQPRERMAAANVGVLVSEHRCKVPAVVPRDEPSRHEYGHPEQAHRQRLRLFEGKHVNGSEPTTVRKALEPASCEDCRNARPPELCDRVAQSPDEERRQGEHRQCRNARRVMCRANVRMMKMRVAARAAMIGDPSERRRQSRRERHGRGEGWRERPRRAAAPERKQSSARAVRSQPRAPKGRS